MLRWRLLLGVAFIAALAGLCWLDVFLEQRGGAPGNLLQPLALIVALLAAQEVVRLLAARGQSRQDQFLPAGAVLVVGVGASLRMRMPETFPALTGETIMLALAVGIALAIEMYRYRGPGDAIARLAGTSFGLLYIGLLMSFLVELRIVRPGALGMVALASTILVVKAGDTGAYTVGRLFGRHKMAPTLSPGKTWEGLAGGLVFSCFGAWLALGPWASYVSGQPYAAAWQWISFGLLVGGAGVLGDLAESLLKREAGVKDSSSWMPGFGGVLDLLDSLLFAAPVGWLLWWLGATGH